MALSQTQSGLLDRLAIGLSGLCVIHCVASAVIVTALASVGGVLLDPRVHEIGLAIAIVIGLAALGQGYRTHRKTLPIAIGSLGLGVMAGAMTLPHGLLEIPVTILGVSTLALGHYLNRKAVI